MTLLAGWIRPSLPLALAPLIGSSCAVDRTTTPAVIAFELAGLVLLLAALWWLRRLRDRLPMRLALMAIGVLSFELFTAPMWNNAHLGRWAYLYRDVSWVLTLGWSVLFLVVVELVDRLLPRWRALPRFAVDLALLTLITVPLEILLVAIGVRSYSPEVHAAAVGGFMAGVPLAIPYYVPVFAALVLGFYKYWCFVLEDTLLIPVRRIRWGRGLLLATLAVLLFELMVEPMVVNQGFPAWSYLYRDISVLMTGVWVLVIALTGMIVYRVFASRPVAVRMVIAVLVATAIALPIEYALYATGMRVYGPSAVANFSGFTIPVLQAPVEIAFAIPFYMALVLATVRYWEIVLDNRL